MATLHTKQGDVVSIVESKGGDDLLLAINGGRYIELTYNEVMELMGMLEGEEF